jgi:hypothetical protein
MAVGLRNAKSDEIRRLGVALAKAEADALPLLPRDDHPRLFTGLKYIRAYIVRELLAQEVLEAQALSDLEPSAFKLEVLAFKKRKLEALDAERAKEAS